MHFDASGTSSVRRCDEGGAERGHGGMHLPRCRVDVKPVLEVRAIQRRSRQLCAMSEDGINRRHLCNAVADLVGRLGTSERMVNGLTTQT